VLGSGVLHALVAKGRGIDAGEQMLTLTQKDRRNHAVQLVDQASAEVLASAKEAAQVARRSGVVIASRSFRGLNPKESS
jgi:hypothetical protein